jgi:hypothetical protein
MITETASLREVRRSLAASEGLNESAAMFLHSTLAVWQLNELLVPMDFVLAELVRWMSGHGMSPEMRCSLTWDQNLVFIELRDRGGLAPEPHVSRVDAELAMRLLAPPAVEWGAELDARGRQLWVAFGTGIYTFSPSDDFLPGGGA